MIMANLITVVSELIKSGLQSFIDTDFGLVSYESTGLAIGAGLFLLLALIYKFSFGKNKYKRPYSGQRIDRVNQRGMLARGILLIPKLILGLAALIMLAGLANPYLPRTKIVEKIESRERVDLIDVSPSKGWAYKNTRKSAGQVGREAHLKFLEMRKDQNDRVALWIFSFWPTMPQGFTMDMDVYMMEVEDAPYVKVDPKSQFLPENNKDGKYLNIVAPKDRIELIEGEGGTDLARALDSVINYFDWAGDKKIKERALLIETDAAVEQFPEKELKELQKRHIRIYFLYMEPNEIGENQARASQTGHFDRITNGKLLKIAVTKYGGKFYDIGDAGSLDRAYQDINRLETAPVNIERIQTKVYIYQRYVITAAVLAFSAILLGLLIEVLLGVDP